MGAEDFRAVQQDPSRDPSGGRAEVGLRIEDRACDPIVGLKHPEEGHTRTGQRIHGGGYDGRVVEPEEMSDFVSRNRLEIEGSRGAVGGEELVGIEEDIGIQNRGILDARVNNR